MTFFSQKILHLEEFENKLSGRFHFFYKLPMIKSMWQGEKAWLSVRFRQGEAAAKDERVAGERDWGISSPLPPWFSNPILICIFGRRVFPKTESPAWQPDSLVSIFLFSLVSLTILSFFNLFRSWVVLTSCCVESSVPQHPSLISLPPFPQLCGKLHHYNALTQTLWVECSFLLGPRLLEGFTIKPTICYLVEGYLKQSFVLFWKNWCVRK